MSMISWAKNPVNVENECRLDGEKFSGPCVGCHAILNIEPYHVAHQK